MSSRNEAAERLNRWAPDPVVSPPEYLEWLQTKQAALAAERRATVERIRAALDADSFYGSYKTPRGRLNAILDEVASAQEEAAK